MVLTSSSGVSGLTAIADQRQLIHRNSVLLLIRRRHRVHDGTDSRCSTGGVSPALPHMALLTPSLLPPSSNAAQAFPALASPAHEQQQQHAILRLHCALRSGVVDCCAFSPHRPPRTAVPVLIESTCTRVDSVIAGWLRIHSSAESKQCKFTSYTRCVHALRCVGIPTHFHLSM